MKLCDVLHVAVYEAKQQSRGWIFRLFVIFSLVGITFSQMFLQGEGCVNWKLVALPASVPLMNAYLFSFLQSLFVIFMITEFPHRERMGGTLDPIYARPMENDDYIWGRILGNLLLFSIVNLAVMLSCIFFVNLRSLAPFNPWYYLFYFFTLNIPSLLFMMGLSLWLVRIVRFRYLAILLSLIWIIITIVWLPYFWHGTFDFLATGVPNLFSDVTGHLGLGYYLLHRMIYLLLGIGFIVFSVKKTNRLPNRKGQLMLYARNGIIFILLGIACSVLLEASYWPVRNVRKEYRESFRRHWKGVPSHVKSHGIKMEQKGDILSLESDMILCNLAKEDIDQPILFLNPGLQITAMDEEGKRINYKRDGQVILIDRSLASGDSLKLKILYSGKIDERFTGLQLSDRDYEDAFNNDRFFATGRRSAFVGDEYLLLTPACGWYPTAIAPVHPFMPMITGNDMTRYRLAVVAPRQASVFSQGVTSERGDTLLFIPSGCLSGISVCGGEFKARQVDVDSSIRLSLNTFVEPKVFLEHFAPTKMEDIKLFFYENPYMFPFGLNLKDISWWAGNRAHLQFIETPLAFRVESNIGRNLGGQVEPGIFFLPERGFTLDMLRIIGKPFRDGKPTPMDIGNGEVYMAESQNPTLEQSINIWISLSADWIMGMNSHPLIRPNAYALSALKINPSDIAALTSDRRLSIYSEQYPFANILFEKFYTDKVFLLGNGGRYGVGNMNKARNYVRDHSLKEAILDEKIDPETQFNVMLWSLRDLICRIGLKISSNAFFEAIDDIYHTHQGMIRFEDFCEELKVRTGADIAAVFDKWLNVRHNQYFKIKDLTMFSHHDNGSYGSGWFELEGKTMNCGDEGGFVTINVEKDNIIQRHSYFLNPGEAKSFYIAFYSEWGPTATFNTGMSSNRPDSFRDWEIGTRKKPENLSATDAVWTTLDPSIFDLDSKEIMVDNLDAGFSFDDRVNQSILQKWSGIRNREDFPFIKKDGESLRLWNSAIGASFQGDSVRSCYYKSFGKGSCTATWKAQIKEKGKYRIMAKNGYSPFVRHYQFPDGYFSDIILYYTIKSEGKEENIEIEATDIELHPEWVSLGEFDLPEGEVSITLSDKDKRERKELAIIADAVKWVKLD